MIENRDIYIAIRRAILTVLAVFDRKYGVKGNGDGEREKGGASPA